MRHYLHCKCNVNCVFSCFGYGIIFFKPDKYLTTPSQVKDQVGCILKHVHYQGFGFIKSEDDGKKYFFHNEQLEKEFLPEKGSKGLKLKVGQYVMFDTFSIQNPVFDNNSCMRVRPYKDGGVDAAFHIE